VRVGNRIRESEEGDKEVIVRKVNKGVVEDKKIEKKLSWEHNSLAMLVTVWQCY
jgi:hypothetical protein